MNNIRWEDQVFVNRNQAYGAYVLRKNYSGSVTRSFAFAMVVVSAIIVSPMVKDMFASEVETTPRPKIIGGPHNPLPPPLIDLDKIPQHASVSPPKTIRFVPPKPSPNDVTEVTPTVQELQGANIASFDSDGEALFIDDQVIVEPVKEAGDDPNKVWINVEVQPAYPGGYAEMMKFISKNTKYPSQPARLGIEGTAFIEFVVNEDGSINMVNTVRPLHPDLDKEAMRVISKMPAWSPGKQNGKAVKVKFVLPIRFRLGE